MIKYTLKCAKDHRFESWFASSEAYETLARGGHVACIHCGDTQITKTLMAPSVPAKGEVRDQSPSLSETVTPQEKALADLRRKVEENADYVGLSFAKEARDIHEGTAPDRPIYGEANLKEAKALLEDGVPVMPLPFGNKRKAN